MGEFIDLGVAVVALILVLFLLCGVVAFAVGVWTVVIYCILVYGFGWVAMSAGTIGVSIALAIMWLVLINAIGQSRKVTVEYQKRPWKD